MLEKPVVYVKGSVRKERSLKGPRFAAGVG